MGAIETRALRREFKGGIVAVDGIDLDIGSGEVYGFLGPNGSGKSTLLKAIAGAHFPSTGRILFDGIDITTMQPYQRSRCGLSLKFQITSVLVELSVYDNVLLALQATEDYGALLRSRSRKRLDGEVMHALERFRLAGRAEDLAGELSHGEQQVAFGSREDYGSPTPKEY